jgi:type III pantothenate kinase
MNLLVDIGNSRIKWGLSTQGGIVAQTAVSHHAENWRKTVFSAWKNLAKPQQLAVSCVANEEILAAVIELARCLWGEINVIIPKSSASIFGVRNAYQQPEKLGIDRWLCLIAAKHYFPLPAWSIDCGTAITVDFLDSGGIHRGGLIAPGLNLMKKSLLQNTAALEFSNTQYALELAVQTDAAIFSGTLYAGIGLIEQAIKQRSGAAVLLLTGGAALAVSPYLSCPVQIEQDLVLMGLSIFCDADT